MTIRRLAASTFALTLALAAAGPARADGPSKPAAQPQVQAVNPNAAMLLPAVQVTVPNAAMVPGETKALTATVSSSGQPVPHGTVTFIVDGTSVGTATTDPSGKASLSWKCTNKAQGSYDLVAKFAGDKSFRAGEGKGKLAVFKAMTETKIEFTTVANEGGSSPALPIFILHVTRKSDGLKMDARLDVKVNGAVFKAPTGENPKTESANVFPGKKGPWTVAAQYNGDDYAQPSSDTKTHQ